jgi:hypothetical protein
MANAAVTVEQAFQRAFQLHGQGELRQARRIYESIYHKVRGHPGSLQMLASIAYHEGDTTSAEVYRDRAIENYRAAIRDIPATQVGPIMNMRAGLMNLLLSADRVEEAAREARTLRLPLNPMFAEPDDWQTLRAEALQAGRPTILVNTIPKSASETLWNRLASGLRMAQCHVSLGLFPNCMLVPHRMREAARGGIVTKEHLAPTAFNVRELRRAGVDRLVLQLRDPRQVVLSWAHFVRDDISRTPLGPLWRQTCPPAERLTGDLGGLIDWCIDHYLPRVIAFIEGWQRIDADPDSGLSVLHTTFEEWLDDRAAVIRRILDFHAIPDAEAVLEADAADGHFRKGKRDEWREVFTEAQIQRANAQIPAALRERFGWPA